MWNPKRFVGIDNQDREDSKYFQQWKTSRNLDDCVRTYWRTDQTNEMKLHNIVHEDLEGHLDLVIDDASHMYEQTKGVLNIVSTPSAWRPIYNRRLVLGMLAFPTVRLFVAPWNGIT